MGQKSDAMWTREHLCIQCTLVKKANTSQQNVLYRLLTTPIQPDEAYYYEGEIAVVSESSLFSLRISLYLLHLTMQVQLSLVYA